MLSHNCVDVFGQQRIRGGCVGQRPRKVAAGESEVTKQVKTDQKTVLQSCSC